MVQGIDILIKGSFMHIHAHINMHIYIHMYNAYIFSICRYNVLACVMHLPQHVLCAAFRLCYV